MGINETLNPWQRQAYKERRSRKTSFIYCPTCRRYRWAEVLDTGYECLECGSIVEKDGIPNG